MYMSLSLNELSFLVMKILQFCAESSNTAFERSAYVDIFILLHFLKGYFSRLAMLCPHIDGKNACNSLSLLMIIKLRSFSLYKLSFKTENDMLRFIKKYNKTLKGLLSYLHEK